MVFRATRFLDVFTALAVHFFVDSCCNLCHITWILVDAILLHTAELYLLADGFLSCMSVSIVFKLNQL